MTYGKESRSERVREAVEIGASRWRP